MELFNLLFALLSSIPSILALSFPSNAADSPSFNTHDPVSILDAYGPSPGYADWLQSGIREPGPLDHKKRRVVRYCFADQETRDKLKCAFENAITLWSDALGGPSNPKTGHSLFFKEVKGPDGQHAFCFKGNYDAKKKEGAWNNGVVAPDTLVVAIVPDQPPRSTTGYIPSEESDKPWRHFMELPPDVQRSDRNHIIAHEVSLSFPPPTDFANKTQIGHG